MANPNDFAGTLKMHYNSTAKLYIYLLDLDPVQTNLKQKDLFVLFLLSIKD